MVFGTKNLEYIIVIIIGLIMTLIGYMNIDISQSLNSNELMHYGSKIAGYAGIIMIIINGTFNASKLFWWTIASLVIMQIGMLLKIMHLPYNNEVIVFSLTSISILYSIHFFKKYNKKRLDYLKYAWLIVGNSLAIMILYHLIDKDLLFLKTVLLYLMVIDYLKIEAKNKRLLN